MRSGTGLVTASLFTWQQGCSNTQPQPHEASRKPQPSCSTNICSGMRHISPMWTRIYAAPHQCHTHANLGMVKQNVTFVTQWFSRYLVALPWLKLFKRKKTIDIPEAYHIRICVVLFENLFHYSWNNQQCQSPEEEKQDFLCTEVVPWLLPYSMQTDWIQVYLLCAQEHWLSSTKESM